MLPGLNEKLPTNAQILEFIETFQDCYETHTLHVLLNEKSRECWLHFNILVDSFYKLIKDKNTGNLYQSLFQFKHPNSVNFSQCIDLLFTKDFQDLLLSIDKCLFRILCYEKESDEDAPRLVENAQVVSSSSSQKSEYSIRQFTPQEKLEISNELCVILDQFVRKYPSVASQIVHEIESPYQETGFISAARAYYASALITFKNLMKNLSPPFEQLWINSSAVSKHFQSDPVLHEFQIKSVEVVQKALKDPDILNDPQVINQVACLIDHFRTHCYGLYAQDFTIWVRSLRETIDTYLNDELVQQFVEHLDSFQTNFFNNSPIGIKHYALLDIIMVLAPIYMKRLTEMEMPPINGQVYGIAYKTGPYYLNLRQFIPYSISVDAVNKLYVEFDRQASNFRREIMFNLNEMAFKINTELALNVFGREFKGPLKIVANNMSIQVCMKWTSKPSLKLVGFEKPHLLVDYPYKFVPIKRKIHRLIRKGIENTLEKMEIFLNDSKFITEHGYDEYVKNIDCFLSQFTLSKDKDEEFAEKADDVCISPIFEPKRIFRHSIC